ncbi:DUF6932 family protein [Brumimicrobium oceani]|uniref:Polymerase nucleotidyl transferase domain-containing protein n=1 Tax=Brumimicrobium oceani TaxID=2100725 RepID=A0A2U2X0J2_9FLAO|nr:hypothetical protein [Brumimicrobium oceani]PWH81291.1 hypothetical protein DIT68_15675 [Brumimicrobium oceani]
MLKFNNLGHLVPNKPISSDIIELEKYFVIEYSSIERSKIFEQYLRYSSDLKKICGDIEIKQWINGSFISRSQPRPNDIDLVSFIDKDIIQTLGEELKPFTYPSCKNVYHGVDAYLTESNDSIADYNMAYWHHQFDTTKRNLRNGKKLPKGFLEIIY